MWSQARYYVLGLLLLAGCGFQPVYGKKENQTAAVSQFGGVKIDPVFNGGRPGQILREQLEDNLNPQGAVPSNPAYRLNVTLTTAESAIGVSRDGTVSRYNVYLTSTYTLFRTSDNKQVASGTLSDVSSYNNLADSYFSTYISSEDATKQGVMDLAQMYKNRLSAYFQQGAPEQNAKPADPTAPTQPTNALNPFSKTGYPYP